MTIDIDIFCSDKVRLRMPPITNDSMSKIDGKPSIKKVLIVDDEVDLADITGLLFDAMGLETTVAYSAEHALTILRDDPIIDTVFSDIMMPDMNGIELSHIIKNCHPHIKIVLTSGYIPAHILASIEESILFISKPYDLDDAMKILNY